MPKNARIQPIIDYGSTLWDSASADEYFYLLNPKALVSLDKRALKAILLKKHY